MDEPIPGDTERGSARGSRGSCPAAAIEALGLVLIVWLLPSMSWAAGTQTTHLAYLDPGTGSFVIQVVAGLLAGIAIAARSYWARIKGFFGGTREPAGEEDPAAVGSTDDD